MSGQRHDLKVWPEFFEALWSKRKTFEIRVNDRGFQTGDSVYLWEFDPSKPSSQAKYQYTRRCVSAKIGYVLGHSPVRSQMEPLGNGRIVFSLTSMRPFEAAYGQVPTS